MSDTLHVVALPHTQTNDEYVDCAYTQRVVKLCKMMTGGERRVILYSGDENTAPCDEHVAIFTEKRRQEWFGKHDPNDLDRGGLDWDARKPWWVETNSRAAGEIAARQTYDAAGRSTDILCLSMGQSHQLIAEALPGNIVAEFCVGYEGIILKRRVSPSFCAFESSAHRHYVYGLQRWAWGRKFDTVIPNQFDPAELPFGEGGDYLVFIGRLVDGKDPPVAASIAAALGMRLVVAGAGGIEHGPGFVRYSGGEMRAPGLEYVGPVGVKERAELLGGAAVCLMPTNYSEPFGGVAVEAMMCGTPAVTTDYGAFPETVVQGVSGYRFQTLQEAIDRTRYATVLKREDVRKYAMSNFSLGVVKPMYERWFDNLDLLWDGGFMQLRQESAPADFVAA